MSAGSVSEAEADWVGLDLAEGREGAASVWVIDGQGARAAEGKLPWSDGAAAQGEGWAALRGWLEACGVVGAGAVPVLIAGPHGMAASRAVPCPPLPERLEPPGGGQAQAALRLVPVPGLLQGSPSDLAQGVSTRIAGCLAQAPDFDGVILCVNGRRSVWAHVSAGEVVSFQSFLSGELLAALAPVGVARASLAQEPAFAEALAAAQARPERLAAHLAGARAALDCGAVDGTVAGARIAAALIGAELAAARAYWLGRDLVLIGSGPLAEAYSAALVQQGITPARMDDSATALAGLAIARGRLRAG